ncbi:MAG: zinc ABC transporter substrate-binding protein [Ruminococcus sp.]|nr:zinc ABC transporter substrate-binding protein [Ruminococcus sp.]
MAKKLSAIFLSLVILIGVMSGCVNADINKDNKKISIVTTIFPIYDWVKEISGDTDIELKMLIDNGVDPHSFQLSADDIVTISDSDMFIYVGGESDEWVEDALEVAPNEDRVVINLLNVLSDEAKEEEVVEGMQAERRDEAEYDEHVWLSLKNAEKLCDYIGKKLCKLNAEYKNKYKSNTKTYIKKLNKLDNDYKTAVEDAKFKTVLFGDRFPFRYLFDDYGLSYFAAFAGCSSETEASFETIAFLSKKADELSLKSIVQIDGSDGSVAQTIKDSTKGKNQKIITLNSMQSISKKDVESGATYLSVMEDNLKVLKLALK